MLLGLAAASFANTESLIYKGIAPYGKYDVYLDGSKKSVNAGAMKFEFGSTDMNGYLLCTEITQHVASAGQRKTYYAYEKNGHVGWLAQEFANLTADPNFDAAKAAGLQLAVWEVVYDGAGNASDLYKGDFKVKSANNSLGSQGLYWAEYYMNELNGQKADYTAYKNWYYQDYVGANPVPEPATLLALAAGGALMVRRRRKKNA